MSFDVANAKLFEILTSGEVAESLGKDPFKMEGSVFYGIGGLTPAKNRGRLPFIEYEIKNEFSFEADSGGTEEWEATIRLHVGTKSLKNDIVKLRSMFDVTSRLIFSLIIEKLPCNAESTAWSVGDFISQPWGFYADLSSTFATSFNKQSFGC